MAGEPQYSPLPICVSNQTLLFGSTFQNNHVVDPFFPGSRYHLKEPFKLILDLSFGVPTVVDISRVAVDKASLIGSEEHNRCCYLLRIADTSLCSGHPRDFPLLPSRIKFRYLFQAMAVSTKPGQIALHRIPASRYSFDIVRASCRTAPLDMQ